MAPIRTYTNWNKRSTDIEEKVEPYRKYFFICEGKNTEVWYFKKLIDIRKSLGIHPLIDIRLMEKTGEDDSISNPKALIEFAEKQKKITGNDFDIKHDRMIIVFDADIYKTKPKVYESILELAGEENILAVSNPGFELFLLLHYVNSVNDIIFPEKEQILENKKEGKRRYIAKRFTDISGMNPKENAAIGDLAIYIDTAIEQEKLLNEDITNAIGHITCNIGKVIEDIRKDSILYGE